MEDGSWEDNGDAQEVGNMPHDAVMDFSGGGDVATPSHSDRNEEAGSEVGTLKNKPHDYSVNIGDDDSHVATPPGAGNAGASIRNKPHDYAVNLAGAGHIQTPPGQGRGAPSPGNLSPAGSTPTAAPAIAGAGEYDPSRYAHLECDDEVKEIFKFISAFTPTRIELDVPLKPFVPDYIAAVGEIDVFVKVPRPDGKPDELGLIALDEPSARQSSPAIVWIEMTYLETSSTVSPFVKAVDDAIKRPLLIDNWVKSVDEIHRNAKPSSTVAYSKPMPSADALLEVWPSEFEEQLSKPDMMLPPGDLDVDLVEYSKICCALVDIPVYQKPIESLHAFFTLYADFKQNVHFQANAFGGD